MSEVDKYSELKLVAGKATPGPWWIDSHGMNMTSMPKLEVVFSHPAEGDAVRNAETGNLSHWRNDWDASYIATANPKTILELIDDFDAQRLRADTAEAENRILRHSNASFLETVAKVCGLLGIDLDDAKHADGQPSDVLFIHAKDQAEKLAAAEQRIASTSELLKKFFEFVEMAPVSSGVCCCGSDTSQENHGDHMAVDQWDHSVSLWGREIDAALNPNPEAESHE